MENGHNEKCTERLMNNNKTHACATGLMRNKGDYGSIKKQRSLPETNVLGTNNAALQECGTVGIMTKQVSLPETEVNGIVCVNTNEKQENNVRHSWSTYLSVNSSSGTFLSPCASSNTLSGSMYTASEGMRTSVSGVTSFSETADMFFTPVGGSCASLSHSQCSAYPKSLSSIPSGMSESMEKEDFLRENMLNEERLRDIQQMKRDKSKESFKSKLIKSVKKQKGAKSQKHIKSENGNTCISDGKVKLKQNKKVIKSPEKQLLVTVDSGKLSKNSHVTSVMPSILKTSASSDSGLVIENRFNTRREKQLGGTKTVLVEKVDWCCIV